MMVYFFQETTDSSFQLLRTCHMTVLEKLVEIDFRIVEIICVSHCREKYELQHDRVRELTFCNSGNTILDNDVTFRCQLDVTFVFRNDVTF